MRGYKGAVILVSHDRYFLDRIVTKVIEVFMHQVRMYAGNYSEYSKKKAEIRAAQMKQYLNQQREIAHQEEVIAKLKSFNREKSIKRAESREKALEKIEVLEKPVEFVTAERKLFTIFQGDGFLENIAHIFKIYQVAFMDAHEALIS